MKISKLFGRCGGACSLALFLASPLVGWAQPKEQVLKVIASGPPGASLDFVARVLADGLQAELKRIAIVENKAGAGGLIGVNELLKSPSDGNTVLVMLDSIQTELPHLTSLGFDIAKDVKPIAQLARTGLAIAGHPSIPGKTLKDLIKYTKSNPGKMSYASYGAGGASHLAGMLFNELAGLDMAHVPYKGATQAVIDTVAGHVPLIVAGIGNLSPPIKNGSLNAYAVSLPKRSTRMPDVPTFTELGYPEIQIEMWVGLWMRPDSPQEAQDAIRNAALKVMSSPAMGARLADFGLDAGESFSPEQLIEINRNSYEKRGRDLKRIKFNP